MFGMAIEVLVFGSKAEVMFRNYIKVAFRNLIKNRIFSAINILGLAVGLCCSILIGLWVWDEYSHDQFHQKKDRIFHAIAEINAGGKTVFWTGTPGPLAAVLNERVAGVEATVRVSKPTAPLLTVGEKKIKPHGLYADSAFFHVFSFPLRYGDAATALKKPYSIVISRQLADQLFNGQDPIGQTVSVRDFGEREEYVVTGVLESIPAQSTFRFDFVMPYRPYYKKRSWLSKWGNYDDKTYVLLAEGAEQAGVKEQVRNIIGKHQNLDFENQLHLYPFKDIYLKADFSRGLEEGGRIKLVKMFMVIAVLILVIASINFMNLSTARATKRAREVGVRKATGADRSSLVIQFLGESVLITLISVLLAVTLADILLPFYNVLTEKNITIPYGSMQFLVSLLLGGIVVGVFAGSYPAIQLSSFQAARVLKGAAEPSRSSGNLRRVLVVFQFTLSIILITGTLIIYNQIQFVLNKDLGIAKENILYHPLHKAYKQKEAFRNDVLSLPGVKSVTFASSSPLSIANTTYSVEWSGKTEQEELPFHVIQADTNVIETFDLILLEGSLNVSQDSLWYVLLNEEAVRVMGLDDPAGEEIQVWGNKSKVLGVVNDFNHQNLFQKIDPVVVLLNNTGGTSFIALESDEISKTVAAVEQVFKKYDQEYPFEYSFADQEYEKDYRMIVTAGTLSNTFAVVTIIISCLGLFGLASFMTEQRRKETGIRKVFGASVYHLTRLFSMGFLRLVLISFLISVPLAWYLADYWLNFFAYRIDISWIPFIAGGSSALIIALLTVGYHTVRAALANPVDSLRHE